MGLDRGDHAGKHVVYAEQAADFGLDARPGARAELARVFKTYTAALMKDYSASTMAGDPNVTSEEQHVEQTIKSFTKAELGGVQIVDHYKDPETGELFTLARLELTAFEDYLKQAKDLSEAVRQKVVRNAEKAFEELLKNKETNVKILLTLDK